jgi:hypothetical protein
VQCRSRGCSFEAICEAIGCSPADFIGPRNGDPGFVATYDYVDELGVLLFQGAACWFESEYGEPPVVETSDPGQVYAAAERFRRERAVLVPPALGADRRHPKSVNRTRAAVRKWRAGDAISFADRTLRLVGHRDDDN